MFNWLQGRERDLGTGSEFQERVGKLAPSLWEKVRVRASAMSKRNHCKSYCVPMRIRD